MHTKYSNIFWHEGVKIFEERRLDTAKGLLRSFLRMLHLKDAPESLTLDFQVTDTETYRRQPRSISGFNLHST